MTKRSVLLSWRQGIPRPSPADSLVPVRSLARPSRSVIDRPREARSVDSTRHRRVPRSVWSDTEFSSAYYPIEDSSRFGAGRTSRGFDGSAGPVALGRDDRLEVVVIDERLVERSKRGRRRAVLPSITSVSVSAAAAATRPLRRRLPATTIPPAVSSGSDSARYSSYSDLMASRKTRSNGPSSRGTENRSSDLAAR